MLRGGEAALAGMVPTPGCQMHSLTFMRRRLPINPGFQSNQQLAQSLESGSPGLVPTAIYRQRILFCSAGGEPASRSPNVTPAATGDRLQTARQLGPSQQPQKSRGQSLWQLRGQRPRAARRLARARSQWPLFALLCPVPRCTGLALLCMENNNKIGEKFPQMSGVLAKCSIAGGFYFIIIIPHFPHFSLQWPLQREPARSPEHRKAGHRQRLPSLE